MAARRKLEPVGPQDRPDDLREVLAVARAVVAQEGQITERLENKARQQVILGAQWFAVVQAVLAVALGHRDTSNDTILWVAAVVAAAGGIALAALGVMGWRVWRIRKDHEVTADGLRQMGEYAHDPPEHSG